MTSEDAPASLGGVAMLPTVETTIYDFGAVSIEYSAAMPEDFGALLGLAEKLTDNAELLRDATGRAEALIRTLAGALQRPGLARPVEDYIIFSITGAERDHGQTAGAWVEAERGLVARVLRAEPGSLSEQEQSDATSGVVCYSDRDAAVIDWNAALVLDDDPADVLEVLAFANVELLEMRYLDRKLEESLGAEFEAPASRPTLWSFRARRKLHAQMERLADLHADSAQLFEGVNGSLKLVGDQHLARVYRAAAKRFHLSEWDEGILRKLGVLNDRHEKLSDIAATRRAEVLEWIIILLIAFEVVMGLWDRLTK